MLNQHCQTRGRINVSRPHHLGGDLAKVGQRACEIKVLMDDLHMDEASL